MSHLFNGASIVVKETFDITEGARNGSYIKLGVYNVADIISTLGPEGFAVYTYLLSEIAVNDELPTINKVSNDLNVKKSEAIRIINFLVCYKHDNVYLFHEGILKRYNVNNEEIYKR